MRQKFSRIYIEITNACNLSCTFCPGTGRNLQFMSKGLFKEILQKLKGHTEYLYFHVMGEPTLHSKLGVFLDLCGDYGYQVNLTTNGSLLDKVGEQLLGKKALRQVNISLHSQESSVVAEDYFHKIFTFVRQSDCYISLRLWNLSSGINNEHFLAKIEEEFKLPFKSIGNKLKPNSGIKLSDRVFLNPASVFQWPSLEAPVIPGQAFCYGLNNQVAILVDGTVVPCCLDGEGVVSLGNIQEDTLYDIINSPRAQAIITGFRQGQAVEELCQKCGYRKRFTN